MSQHRWVRVTACDNIPPREGRAAHIGDREIAIFNIGGRFLAVDSLCPHKAGPLNDGIVAGTSVVCPLHAWKVNLETGAVQRPAGVAACVRTYTTRVEAGIILIEVPAKTVANDAPPPCESAKGEGQAA